MAKILIAEDEPDIRELVTFMLKFAGYEVVAASNGEDAVRTASRERPDLVDQVTVWGFAEWGHLNPGETLERRRGRIRGKMNVDRVPVAFVAGIAALNDVARARAPHRRVQPGRSFSRCCEDTGCNALPGTCGSDLSSAPWRGATSPSPTGPMACAYGLFPYALRALGFGRLCLVPSAWTASRRSQNRQIAESLNPSPVC